MEKSSAAQKGNPKFSRYTPYNSQQGFQSFNENLLLFLLSLGSRVAQASLKLIV